MMDFERLRLEVVDGLARLTFCCAERGNPIDGRFCDEMAEAVIRLSEETGVRCVLIRAEGKAFGYGGDIASFIGNLDELPRNIKRWTMTLHSAVSRLQRIDAPVVASVQGVCAGGMVGLAAGADLLIASEDAKFVAAYAGIGFANDAGTSVMLSRRMGIARARRFLLMNETLDAEAALAIGLVDEVHAQDACAARAEAIALRFATGPTKAFGEMRRLLTSVEDQPLDAQLELEAQALARCAGSADAREAIIAFSERRKPIFRGY
ncbi:enoyl-CoA hydratase/isomerase family protein [Sphingomonas profundi]|uniref:enoyl-CoA hydratase/isomerase family protein n=1 Tax=Alterirhizorhabdus profundi TaxID=2681549 RepID=UPI0012E87523|nr:enoyl-CoA hydratase-related protein [Sphingomonas profundi]